MNKKLVDYTDTLFCSSAINILIPTTLKIINKIRVVQHSVSC